MKVYLVEHDHGSYNWDEMWLRGVYVSRQAAETAITSQDNPGNWLEHDEKCCTIEEWEVQSAAKVYA